MNQNGYHPLPSDPPDPRNLKPSKIAKLREAKNYSEAIIETLWEPLVALDSDFHIKSANKSFYRFFKLSKLETSHKLIYDLGNGQWSTPRLKELLEDLLVRHESVHSFELKHIFPKLGPKTLLLNADRIIFKNGQKEKVIILTFQDVTEQRRAEVALNKIASDLSFSNTELDNFASTAAHDLQSPLLKIRVFAERLLEDTITEKGKAYLQTMIKSSTRMRHLIESLLNVARVTNQGHGRERIDLDEAMKEVVLDLEIPIQESGAVIDQKPLPVVMANRVQMHQLFQNLIGNAIKYRKKNEPLRITVGSRLTDDSVEITVTDNGIGFDGKYSRDVFKPFKRLHGNSEYEGSGIGLTLCQKIVRDHGGEITTESKPGEGAAFLLKWPLKILSVSPMEN